MTSPGAYSAGTAFLDVVPSFRGVQNAIAREVRGMEAALGKAGGEAFGREFGKGAKRAVDDALGTSRAKEAAAKSGAESAGAFADTFNKTITSAISKMKPIKLEADTKGVERQMALLQQRLSNLRGSSLKVDFDSALGIAQLKAIQKELDELSRSAPTARVRFDSAQASAQIALFERQLGGVSGKTADVKVKADTKGVDKMDGALRRLNSVLKVTNQNAVDNGSSLRAFNGVVLGVAAGIAPLAPLLGAAAGAMVLLGTAAIGAGAGLAVMGFGFSGISGAVQALGKAQETAGKDAEDHARKVRTAGESVANAQRSVERAEQSAARSARDSARAVTDARQNAASAAEDAAERVADAQQNASRANENAARAVVDAQRNAAEAAEQTAEAVADAVDRQREAEEDLIDAQREVVRAQEDVTEARERAAERIQDLRLQIEGGALAERQAVLDLAEAQNEYQAALGDPGATAREREELLVRYEREKLALRRIREENGDLAEERAEFNRTGIEGSDEVVSAQERVRDAQGRVAAAMETVGDAAKGVRDALEEQRESATANQRAVADAMRAQRETAADGAEAVADALEAQREAASEGTRAIADALRNQREAATDSQQAIADAQRNLTEAQIRYQEALDDTSTSQENLATEMAKLGPAGQTFALFIHGLRDDFREMRDIVQAGMLPGVQDMISTILEKNGPLIREFLDLMGRAVGDVFRQFGDLMTSPEWQAIWAVFNETAPVFFQQFATIGMNILTGFGNLFVGTAPFAERFGDALVRISEQWVAWTDSFTKSETFQTFMAWFFENGPKIWDTLLSVGGAIGAIFIALEPLGIVILDLIDGFADMIAGMNPKLLGGIITMILGLIIAFQVAAGAVFGFGAVLSVIMLGGVGLWILAIGAVITGLVVLYTQSEIFRDIVNGVFRAIGAVFSWLWNSVIKPIGAFIGDVFGAIGDAAMWLWEEALKPAWAAIGEAWDWLVKAFKWAWENVIRPVWDAIAGAAEILEAILVVAVLGPIAAAWWLLSEAFKWGWENIIRPAWARLKEAGRALYRFLKPFFDMIGDAWDTMGRGLRVVGNWIKENVFDVIQDRWNTLSEDFSNMVDAMGDAWKRLKTAMATPINWVIHYVLNEGLFKAFNWVIETLKLPKDWMIKDRKQISGPGVKQYAAGGKVGGWSPNDVADNIPAMLTAGEWVQPVDTVRYYGADFMEAIRKKKIPRDELRYLATGGEVQGYATGGQIFAATKRVFPRAKLNSSYRPGDPGYHGRNMAADMGEEGFPGGLGRPYIAAMKRWWVDNFGRSAEEIIYNGRGNDRQNVNNGRPYPYSRSTQIQHYNHLHVAESGSLGAVGGPAGSGSGPSFLDIAFALGNPVLAAANNAGFIDVDSVFSSLTKSIAKIADFDQWSGKPARIVKKLPGEMVDMVWGKIKSSVGDFFEGALDSLTGVPDSQHQPFGLQGGPVVDQVRGVAALYGWNSGAQWAALNRLIMKESSWNPTAQNPTSTAYGLFQFLNSTWAGTGIDKTSDPRMQAQAGLKYIKDRYGSPSEALGFHLRNNWYSEGGEVTPAISSGEAAPTLYDSGGWVPPGIHTVLNASRRPEPILTSQQWDDLTASRSAPGAAAPAIGEVNFHEVVTDPDSIIGSLNHWTNVAKRGGRYATVGTP